MRRFIWEYALSVEAHKFHLIQVVYVVLPDVKLRQVLAVLKIHQSADIVHAENDKTQTSLYNIKFELFYCQPKTCSHRAHNINDEWQ